MYQKNSCEYSVPRHVIGNTYLYIHKHLKNRKNNGGNIKIKETTIGIKHQIITRAGTIYIFFLFYCSFHAPFLEVEGQRVCADVCAACSARQIMHVCPTACSCAFPCACDVLPHPSACVHAGAMPRHTELKRTTPPTIISLSTAINKDLFVFLSWHFELCCIPAI